MSRSLAVLGAAALTALLPATASAQSCSRACLDGVLTNYLAAVVRHDPAAAPLGLGYRETVNAAVTVPGEGLWKTMTALGKVQRHYIDPESGGVGYFGTVSEGAKGAVVTLRLLVEDRKVIEAEWVIGRLDSGGPMGPGLGQTSLEGQEQTPPPLGPIPKSQRVSRRAMIAIANGFFDYAQSGNEAAFPGAPNWVRLENGIGTGIGPGGMSRDGKGPYLGREAARRAAMAQGGAAAGPLGGAANRDVCGGICNVAARRYPIVDEEQGVVLSIVVFQRPPANTFLRNLLTEWFTIVDGKITGVYAAMHYMKPTFAAPNWPPYDGNFPLSFNVGISPTPNAAPPAAAPTPPPARGSPAPH